MAVMINIAEGSCFLQRPRWADDVCIQTITHRTEPCDLLTSVCAPAGRKPITMIGLYYDQDGQLIGRRKSTSRQYQVPAGVDNTFWDELAAVVWCDLQGKRIREIIIKPPKQTAAVEDSVAGTSQAGDVAGPKPESVASENEDAPPLPMRQETSGRRVVTRSALAAAPIGAQKQMLYEQLLPLVQARCAEGAETVTDDLMGLDNSEILEAFEDPQKVG